MVGNQRHLAQTAGPFIHAEQVFQDFLSLFCLYIHHLPLFEGEAEIFYEVPVVYEGSRTPDHPVHPIRLGSRVHFFRGNIGVKEETPGAAFRAALPDVALRQAYGEFCPLSAGIFQGGKLLGRHPLSSIFQTCQVAVPVCQGIFAQAPGNGEDIHPELIHPFLLRDRRIEQFCPHRTGHGSHQPVGAGGHHTVGIFLHRLVESPLPGKDFLPVYSLHGVGVSGNETQEGSPLPVVIQVEIAAPGRHGFEVLLGFILIAEADGVIAIPVEYHLPRAAFIGFFRQKRRKPAGLHRRTDHQDLPLLQVDALLEQHPGVEWQLPCYYFVCFHEITPFAHLFHYIRYNWPV